MSSDGYALYSTKFGVDSSGLFFLLERGLTDRQTRTESQTPLITLPTHLLLPRQG